jgi:hypothetical protein
MAIFYSIQAYGNEFVGEGNAENNFEMYFVTMKEMWQYARSKRRTLLSDGESGKLTLNRCEFAGKTSMRETLVMSLNHELPICRKPIAVLAWEAKENA